jgi:hypothetical protein
MGPLGAVSKGKKQMAELRNCITPVTFAADEKYWVSYLNLSVHGSEKQVHCSGCLKLWREGISPTSTRSGAEHF